MHRTFSKRLGYLAILLELCAVFVSVFSSEIINNYNTYENPSSCKSGSCKPSPKYFRDERALPSYSNVNSANNSTRFSSANNNNRIQQWTFVAQSYNPEKANASTDQYIKKQQKNKLKQKSDFRAPVTQAPSLEAQESYYDSVLYQYYPNGTNEFLQNSQQIPTATRKEDHHIDHQIEVVPLALADGGGEINFKADGLKLAVIVVSVFYVIIILVANPNFLHSDHSYNSCVGTPATDFPIWYTLAENPHPSFSPYGDSSSQQQLFDMFGWKSFSEEEDSREMPDLAPLAAMCSKTAFFYGMNHQHMQAVQMVKDILMKERDIDGMMYMARALRHSPHVNPKVWYTALMKVSKERPDMYGMAMPGPLDAMPDTFIPGTGVENAISSYRSDKSRSHKEGKKCIRVDGSVGLDNGKENLLWYFREDVMLNSHHWYWHLSYPLVNTRPVDRRGELFYYTHRSMTTRYNIERLCNGLQFVLPLKVYQGAPIREGYNAHLTDLNSGMPWTDRPPHTLMTDILHQDNPSVMANIILRDWFRSRDRILSSIKHGYFITGKGTKLAIPRYEGIDILGNTLEAVDLSINPRYYDPDGYHNNGHRVIGYSVDPHYHFQLPPGPMADPATAMRDPIFYRWHTNINNIFEKYKRTLKPYQPVGGEFPLLWKGVEVKEVSVVSKGGIRNDLKTFWGRRKFELSLGLAFNRTDDDDDDDKDDYLKVCAAHLDHEEFEYNIHIDRQPCAKSLTNTATVRIFLAPRYNLYGHRYTFLEQRRLFVHLDLFTTELNVGRNVITRRSIDSTLTIPWTQSLRQLQSQAQNPQSPNCGCGWPHHLLLPRGTPDGMPFDLFVMVTNGDDDLVKDHKDSQLGGQCGSAFIYCGIQNQRYPDAKPMGYPFDREVYKVSSICGKGGYSFWYKVCSLFALDWKIPAFLEDYTWGITNMGFSQVLITHIPK